MIPDYDVVVVDEAHELVSRVTQAATDELTRQRRRAGRPPLPAPRRGHRGRRPRRRRRRAGGRRSRRREPRPARHRARAARRRAGAGARRRPGLPVGVPRNRRASAEGRRRPHPGPRARCRRSSRPPSGWPRTPSPTCSGWPRAATASPPRLCVAPLQVWGPMRDKLLTDKTVVFTSATLMLGGDFSAVATSRRAQAGRAGGRRRPGRRRVRCRGRHSPWRGLDVGSPFDYGQQAILYVARHLPPPGRDGLGKAQLDEIVRAGRRRRGPHPGAVLVTPGRRGGGRGGPRAAAPPDHARPGRGAAARAGQAVRRATRTPPVRHAQPVAGARRPGRDLPAGDHRPDPVPAARRPADVGAAARGRPGRRQRLHAGRGHPRGAAARAGHRPA